MTGKIKLFILNKKTVIFAVFSFLIPFIIYLLTLEHKLIGGDTAWYANQIPEMSIMVPTGYPTFSMLEKLFTLVPFGDMAYKLNLFSAIFGALTILFLFLSINKLVKNEFVSFVGSMIFAFIMPFWEVANRLEFDTLNSFFIVLVLFSAVLYSENKTRKYLYFFFFSLGLSLTNHPIAFFVVPAIVLYVIIINPKIFKSVKAVFISILFFILPLTSYFYLLIRSLQGYGEVTTLKRLFYYVTGRNVTGILHGGHFTDRNIIDILLVIKDYLRIIYNSYGVVLIIVAVIGFIFLVRKKRKFGLCSLLFIFFNIIVPPLYLGHANANYMLDTMIMLAVYIAFGFLSIFNFSTSLFNKTLGRKKILKIDKFLRYFLIVIIFLFFAFQPVSFIYANYNKVDLSETDDVYKFWLEAYDNMEEDSKIYIQSPSENISMFINKYEYGEKQIQLIRHTEREYSPDNIEKDFKEGIKVYFIGNDNFLPLFEVEQIGKTYYWSRWYREYLKLYKVVGIKFYKKDIKISHDIDSYSVEFGEVFTLEYIIKNTGQEAAKINSLELELPDSIELVSVEPGGYIDQDPGISREMYMWVSDDYRVNGKSEINIKIDLRGIVPGKSVIKFRITTAGLYISSEDIEVEIEP
jgi:hypothetical protein